MHDPSSTRSAAAGALIAGLFSCLGGACAAPRPDALTEADYPGALRRPDQLGFEVLWQQRVTAVWSDGRQGFDAAVQNRGDELTVIGLSPAGQPGFVFVLDGEEIRAENRSGRELPFPPRFILLDVQRAFWPWLDDGIGVLGTREDGYYELTTPDERIGETWRDGRLQRRTFERVDGKPAGEIAVTYTWTDGMRAPARAVLDNGWFGYALEVETVTENPLDGVDG